MQLTDYRDRKPSQLSGGQRQRVAIGRAIVTSSKVFLFDEPLSNFDTKLRVQMRVELEALHKQLNATMIYVTHDQVEAMTMADKIVVLNGGRIEQVGSPMDLYHRPATKFVAEFIGSPAMNVFSHARVPGLRGLRLDGATASIGCRPEHFTIHLEGAGHFDGTILVREQLGGETLLYARNADDLTLVVRTDGDDTTAPGTQIGLEIPAHRLHRFDADGRAMT